MCRFCRHHAGTTDYIKGRQAARAGGYISRTRGSAAGTADRWGFRTGIRNEPVVWPRSAKNTPAEIVDRLNREVNAAIADPGMKARLAAIGGEPLPGTPGEFGRLIAEETEKWAKVVQRRRLKPE